MRGFYGLPPLGGYNAFSGPGGFSAGGSSGPIQIETWNDYSTGTWGFPQTYWNKSTSLSILTIIADSAYSDMTDQHLSTTSTGGADSDYLLYTPAGSSYDNGQIRCEVTADSLGHNNNQPAVIGRYVDSNNNIHARMSSGDNKLLILEIIGGVVAFTSTSVTITRNKVYYLELDMQGSTITANLYDGADTTTLLATVSRTTAHTSAGKLGINGVGQGGAIAHFDNFAFIQP